MKYQKFLSVFLILIIAYLSANAQDDFPPNAVPGKCYIQCIYPKKYSEEIKQIFEYTGTDYKAAGVKKQVVELSPATTKWKKKEALSENPEDFRHWHLVNIPAKSETYYVVTDSSINKQFKITEIPITVIQQAGDGSSWAELLCERYMKTNLF